MCVSDLIEALSNTSSHAECAKIMQRVDNLRLCAGLLHEDAYASENDANRKAESKASRQRCRIFMTALMVHAKPDMMLCEQDGQDEAHARQRELAEELASDAGSVVKAVGSGEEEEGGRAGACNPGLLLAFERFARTFERWKSGDLADMAEMLRQSYRNVRAMAVEYSADETISKHAAAECEHILACARKLGIEVDGWEVDEASEEAGEGGEAGVSEPPAAAAPSGPSQKAFYSSVEATVRKAFWDGLDARLQAGDTSQLEAMLDELRDALNQLTPSRTDLHEAASRAIDSRLVGQMVRNQAFGADEFQSLTAFVKDRLLMLGAPADDARVNEWHAAFTQKCASGEPYRALLPDLFDFAHQRIEVIHRSAAALRGEGVSHGDGVSNGE